jgi:hypothetical protein
VTRFEVMSEEEARRMVANSRRALRAIIEGDTKSADARAMSFQVETYEDRLAARRRLRSVTDDMSAAEYAIYFREKRDRIEQARSARGVKR